MKKLSIILSSITPAYSWPWSRNRKPVSRRTATLQGQVTNFPNKSSHIRRSSMGRSLQSYNKCKWQELCYP